MHFHLRIVTVSRQICQTSGRRHTLACHRPWDAVPDDTPPATRNIFRH